MSTAHATPHTDSPAAGADIVGARRWLLFSVGALVLAGLFSVGLIIGRMPPFSGWVGDPLFFKRCLVVHVDLALIVWFYAFITGLFHLLPGAPTGGWSLVRVATATLGVVLMVLSAGVDAAEPILANYVPVVDHPLFLLGLGLVGAAVLWSLFGERLTGADDGQPGLLDPASRTGLRAAAVLLVAAAATFVASFAATPTNLGAEAFYELGFWGGGHILQVVSTTAMVAVWLTLVSSLTGRPVVSRTLAGVLFALLALPHLAGPLLTLEGTQTALYHSGFTQLMRWGIFPVVSVFLVLCLRAVWAAFRDGRLTRSSWTDPRLAGFATSAALIVVGFVIGAMIRGSNTMIPAHYHAAIGAVTVSFMTVGILLLEPLGMPVRSPKLRRLAALQPALFGGGQFIFAVGFALAGAHGMGRKVYGAEQQIRGVWDWLGLATMGLGGLVAIAGGLLFLAIVGSAFAGRMARRDAQVEVDRSFALRPTDRGPLDFSPAEFTPHHTHGGMR